MGKENNLNFCSKDVIIKTFSQVLKELRKSKKLTQEDLAFLIESDRSFISQMERGIKQPSLYTLYKLSKALGVESNTLAEKLIRAFSNLS